MVGLVGGWVSGCVGEGWGKLPRALRPLRVR